MDADGKNIRRLTDHAVDGGKYNSNPSWSPDGREIAFASDRDSVNWEIYVMDADGKNVQRLTHQPAGDFQPAWSPDGRKIVFISEQGGKCDIYMMDADGKNIHRLTDQPGGGPAWFSVSSAGKLTTTWGWLKQNSK
jgi:TolB protein